jgi:hypothetical protein
MIRTQIYLTDRQHEELSAISQTLGKTQSDSLIEKTSNSHREIVLREAAGIWKDRTDLPDFTAIRTEWDRR